MKVRVDPAIHIHFDLISTEHAERQMLVEHLRENTRFELLSPAALRALDVARQWIDPDDYVRELAGHGLPPERAAAFLNDAMEKGLLQSDSEWQEDVGRQEEESRGQFLNELGAPLCHQLLLAKSHLSYLDYSASEAAEAEALLMATYSTERNPPAIYKDCENVLRSIALPAQTEARGPFVVWEPMIQSEDPINLERLARFLHVTFGAIGTIGDRVQGELVLKTYPSGGSRHPLECYVAAFSVAGLDPGVYHYSVRRHALDLLATDSEALKACLFPDLRPCFLVVLAICPERVMWRYREPTSICVMMLDLGHAIGNMALASDCEGLHHRIQMIDAPARAGELLGLPPFRESPLAAIAIGEHSFDGCASKQAPTTCRDRRPTASKGRYQVNPALSFGWQTTDSAGTLSFTVRDPLANRAVALCAEEFWLPSWLNQAAGGTLTEDEMTLDASAFTSLARRDVEAMLLRLRDLLFLDESQAAAVNGGVGIWEEFDCKLAFEFFAESLSKSENRCRYFADHGEDPSNGTELPIPAEFPQAYLSRVLYSRRTCREFNGREADVSTLSSLLHRGFARRLRHEPALPAALYHLIVLRVAGMPPGIYTYDPAAHGTNQIRTSSVAELESDLVGMLIGQNYPRGCACALLMSVDTAELFARDRGASALRWWLIGLGRLAQRLIVIGAVHGLRSFPSAAIAGYHERAITGKQPGGWHVPMYCLAFGYGDSLGP